jgi:hypothetical protein
VDSATPNRRECRYIRRLRWAVDSATPNRRECRYIRRLRWAVDSATPNRRECRYIRRLRFSNRLSVVLVLRIYARKGHCASMLSSCLTQGKIAVCLNFRYCYLTVRFHAMRGDHQSRVNTKVRQQQAGCMSVERLKVGKSGGQAWNDVQR